MKKADKTISNTDIYVNLGFAEKPNNQDFHHDKFPSKIGGEPVWLTPLPETPKCDFCGGRMTFLMQLYSIIDSNPKCFHRTLYILVCLKCFTFRQAFKCVRLQLPKDSQYYDGSKIKQNFKEKLLSYRADLDYASTLKPEYSLGIYEESPKATKIYLKFLDDLQETSQKGSIKDFNEDDDEQEGLFEGEYDPQLSKQDNELVDRLMKEYQNNISELDTEFQQTTSKDKEIEDKLEDEFLKKLEVTKPNTDIFFRFFSEVVRFDRDQVVRYCRDGVQPLWYCRNNLMTARNLKCRSCDKKLTFEFQIMPALFILYEPLINHDIGTISVFTCDCDIEYSEEFVYAQRTGEKLIDLKDSKVKGTLLKKETPDTNEQPKEKVLFGGNQDNTPDEDGFIVVNKKKKGNN